MLRLFGLVVLTAACGGNGATAPTPTAVPAVVGPLAVYSENNAAIVFDVGARREVRRVALPDGARSIVFTHERKVAYVVESGGGGEVHTIEPLSGADEVVSRFASPGDRAVLLLSPDGRYAAFTASDNATPQSRTAAGVVDLRSSTTRALATFGDAGPDEFVGLPTLGRWRDDGLGFVVYGERLTGPNPGSMATVMLDGAVLMHGKVPLARLSPNGRAVMDDDVNTVGCVLVKVQRLRIHDLATDTDVAVVEDPGRGLVFNEWSPSGDELLYTQYETTPSREDCLPEFDRASGREYVLSARGGAPSPVADVAALRTRWYGVPVEYGCFGDASLDIWGGCGGNPRILVLNGVPLGIEGRVRLLGVIEAEALAR